MPNNPTIVSASLSDKELQDSINKMVANFDEGLQTMLKHSNEYVGKIQKSLQKIGDTDFGAKGSNDGAVVKQTKQHKDLTEAVTKETQKLQDLQQSLSGASDREQNFVSQKERAANTISQENELLKRQEQELANLKNQLSSFSGTNQQTTASIDKQIANKEKAIADLYYELEKAEGRKRILSKQKNIEDQDFHTERMKARENEILAIKQKITAQEKELAEAQKRLTEARQAGSQAATKATQDEKNLSDVKSQIAAKEKEIAETKGRIAAATKEQSEADKNASQAAKEKANIQSQVANQEKQVAEAKRQLTTATQQHTDAETKSSRATKEKTLTLDQQASAINTAIQSEKKYTEEIRKQAAAIRATKEWQEKGHVVIGDINYYDKERANVSKRDKQLLLSLEEQIVQAQQKESQEALVAAEAKRQQAQAAKEAAQAMRGVSSYDLGINPNISAARERQINSTRRAAQEEQYLRQQIAGLLEIEEREVNQVKITTASYQELSKYLKNLQSAYQRLGSDRIAKGEGTDIANEIQRTQRAMQKLQQTMSRPISLKDAMGLSEKTLDDIAYKMRQLASYRSGLNVDTQKKEITQVNDEYNRLKKRMDEVMQKNQQMIASNTALGRSWNYMKNRLAFYFTVGASTQFVKNLIEVRSQYEMNERALGILINSAERGTQIFNELSQMALVSPYTLIELSTAAKQLTAYDVAAKDVVDTTRRLADMASAVGIPIERLTYALGQIKAYGYLNSRDARMFANAGIPLVKQLSEYYTELEGRLVSTADVYDRIKKKSIDYSDVMQVINHDYIVIAKGQIAGMVF